MVKEKKPLTELLRYIVAGATTTLINLAVYRIFLITGLDYRWANLTALILSKTYGYIVNKLFVFCSHCGSKRQLLIEIGSFISARGFTGLIDYFGLIAMVELLGMNKVYAKYFMQAVVIIFNYISGKFWIFRRKRPQSKKESLEAKEGKINEI